MRDAHGELVTGCSLHVRHPVRHLGRYRLVLSHYSPNVNHVVDILVRHVLLGHMRQRHAVVAQAASALRTVGGGRSKVVKAVLPRGADAASNPLALPGARYHILVSPGALQDAYGNVFPGIGWGQWVVTAGASSRPPSLVSTEPRHNSVGAPQGATRLSLSFDTRVVLGDAGMLRVFDLHNASAEVAAVDVTLPGRADTVCSTLNVHLPSDTLAAFSNRYAVTLDAGAVVSEAGQEPFPGVAMGDWQFTTQPDSDPPAILALQPARDRTDVPTQITTASMTFDEPVQRGASGSFRVIQNVGLVVRASVDITDTTLVTFSGDTVTVTLDATAVALDRTNYHVRLSAGAVLDAAGNAFGGFTSKKQWTFATSDVTPPSLVSHTPEDGATDIGIAGGTVTQLSLDFTEAVLPSAGWITVYASTVPDDSGSLAPPGGIVERVAPTDASRVTIVGGGMRVLVTLQVATLSHWSTTYTVTLSPGSFVDLSGKPFGGVAAGDWTFATEADMYPPSVTRTRPNAGASNVVLTDLLLIIEFDEAVVALGSAGIGGILVTDETSGNALWLAANYTWMDKSTNETVGYLAANNRSLAIPFPESALGGSAHTYRVDVQHDALADVDGNVFPGASFSFSSRDTLPPLATSSVPEHGATLVPRHTSVLELVFDEPVSPGAGTVELVRSSGGITELIMIVTDYDQVRVSGNRVQLLIGANTLAYDTLYHVALPSTALRDASGNTFAGTGVATWQFRTEPDVEAPVAVATQPAVGASGVTMDLQHVSLTFSETITLGTTGGISIVRVDSSTSGGAQRRLLAVTDAVARVAVDDGDNVAVDRTTVTFTVPSGWAESTVTFAVIVEADTVYDAAGNEFLAFADAGSPQWTFTMQDRIAPTALDLTPAAGSLDTSVGLRTLSLTFDEPVRRGSAGVIAVTEDGEAAPTESIQSGHTGRVLLSGSRMKATILLSGAAVPNENTRYIVTVSAGSFVDDFGNAFAGIAASDDWSFTTVADATPPVVVSTTPAASAMGVDVGSTTIGLQFTEGVVPSSTTVLVTVRCGGVDYSADVSDGSSVLVADTNVQVAVQPASGPAPLPEATTCLVTVPASAFLDLRGNAAAETTWVFTTQDATAPTLVAQAPVPGRTGVTELKRITMTFDEAVMVGDGFVTVAAADPATGTNTPTAIVSTSDSGRVQANGATVVVLLEPQAVSLASTTYIITVTPGPGSAGGDPTPAITGTRGFWGLGVWRLRLRLSYLLCVCVPNRS